VFGSMLSDSSTRSAFRGREDVGGGTRPSHADHLREVEAPPVEQAIEAGFGETMEHARVRFQETVAGDEPTFSV